MRYIGVMLILIISVVFLTALTTVVRGEDNSCLNGVLFYIFGESTCPYCKLQHDFFQQNYPASVHYFCIIDKYGDCYNKFIQFVRDELISKANMDTSKIGVPLTIVVKNYGGNKSIVAVVIGAITDKNFWLQLACSQPGENIPVYLMTQQAYFIPVNQTTNGELVNEYIVFPYPPSTNNSGGSSTDAVFLTTLVIVGILVLSITGYMLYSYLRK
ncbi:MAG: hypothetical protein QXE10_04035 [Desulfurococcaceae archaeon]